MNPLDDFSPTPLAPSLVIPDDNTQDSEFLATDKRLARAYFHPAWGGVQDMFEDRIETLRMGCSDTNLPADEYKVIDLANKKVASVLMEVLLNVRTAVESTKGGK